MKKLLNLSLLILLTIVFSCSQDNLSEPIVENKPIVRENISGFVQKGPFAIGTSVTMFELDSLLSQTGRNFNAQITTNDGNFSIKNIVLENSLVEIKADGFYYNEVSGDVSENRLTLYSLSDLTDQNTVNVNVLSYLEKPRIEHLVGSGKTFNEAKKQAQKEVLKIFEIEKDDIVNFEQLDILEEGEDNAILLATSVILQGHRSVAELSELLAKISLDIQTDGILDDSICGSELINHANALKLNHVRANIEDKFELLGKTNEVPDFENYVTNFIDKTNFIYTLGIKYPEVGKYGANILALNDGDSIIAPTDYSIKAILPLNNSLRIRMTRTSSSDDFMSWYYFTPGLEDFPSYELQNINTYTIDLISKENVTETELKVSFQGGGSGVIEIYENGAQYATKTIHYSWGAPQSIGLITEQNGKFGSNLLLMDDNSTLKAGQTYSLELTMPTNLNLDVEVWIVRTAGTGTISFNKNLVENWDTYLSENKGAMNARCFSPGTHLDMPVVFNGVGECELKLRAINSSNPIIFFKNFKWE